MTCMHIGPEQLMADETGLVALEGFSTNGPLQIMSCWPLCFVMRFSDLQRDSAFIMATNDPAGFSEYEQGFLPYYVL